MKAMFDTLNKLLTETDITNVTSESTGFEELPDGYYLCEVEQAELKESKSSHQPMAAFKLKIVEDGKTAEVDEKGNVKIRNIDKTKNRKIFMNYVLKDEKSVKRFVTDMLKFEGDVEGESLLPKEAFTTSETLEDAIDVLTGYQIYVSVSTTENDDGTKSVWNNMISWKRAAALELPM